MKMVQEGDRVHIHYLKRFQDGSVVTSRKGAPIEVTVGVDHPRLPGLGLALVGVAPGTTTSLSVPTHLAYGPADPALVRRWSRKRFPADATLPVGKWVRMRTKSGRSRPVRIISIRGEMVLVDTNHRWAGQSMQLEIDLVSIEAPAAAVEKDDPRD